MPCADADFLKNVKWPCFAKQKSKGFVTFGFSASIDSAKLFATEAGVDVLIINVGWTFYGSEPLESRIACNTRSAMSIRL